ncbi:YcgN family cysteine cluster protein [Hirschia maritima]|uniref:YcgN family cysteine cluster protein n=1 Tax=Hirschia maritima TaxID=1121961 RepID=UPI00037542C0|nr:YcgN family cysteine cluster protein [Hirschia maritima]
MTKTDKDQPFWKTKSLEQLSHEEWESLCDGCGKCCLLKLEDEDSGEIAYTKLHCKLFDASTCRCADYDNRKAKVPECVSLTPSKIPDLKWMPSTCSYRMIWEGKDLPEWHHLISGDRGLIHKLGKSVLGKTVAEDTVFEGTEFDWIVDWEDMEF